MSSASNILKTVLGLSIPSAINSTYVDITGFDNPIETFRSKLTKQEKRHIKKLKSIAEDRAGIDIYDHGLNVWFPHYNTIDHVIAKESMDDEGIFAHEIGHALNAKDLDKNTRIAKAITENSLGILGSSFLPLAIPFAKSSLKDVSKFSPKKLVTKKGLATLATLLSTPRLVEEARASYKGSKLLKEIYDSLEDDHSFTDLLSSWKGFPTYAISALSPASVALTTSIADEKYSKSLDKLIDKLSTGTNNINNLLNKLTKSNKSLKFLIKKRMSNNLHNIKNILSSKNGMLGLAALGVGSQLI